MIVRTNLLLQKILLSSDAVQEGVDRFEIGGRLQFVVEEVLDSCFYGHLDEEGKPNPNAWRCKCSECS